MKTLITTVALALTAAAPVYAQSAAEIFALSNDSAAERFVANTSGGDISAAQRLFAAGKDNAAETIVRKTASTVTRASGFDPEGRERSQKARAFFALSNDSAAERIATF